MSKTKKTSEPVTFNKNELVNSVAAITDLTKKDATRSVEAVIEAITEALVDKKEVRLIGFGTFSVSHRAATTGRNPSTGAPLQIAAYDQPRFRPGKTLKDRVNGK